MRKRDRKVHLITAYGSEGLDQRVEQCSPRAELWSEQRRQRGWSPCPAFQVANICHGSTLARPRSWSWRGRTLLVNHVEY